MGSGLTPENRLGSKDPKSSCAGGSTTGSQRPREEVLPHGLKPRLVTSSHTCVPGMASSLTAHDCGVTQQRPSNSTAPTTLVEQNPWLLRADKPTPRPQLWLLGEAKGKWWTVSSSSVTVRHSRLWVLPGTSQHGQVTMHITHIPEH